MNNNTVIRTDIVKSKVKKTMYFLVSDDAITEHESKEDLKDTLMLILQKHRADRIKIIKGTKHDIFIDIEE